MCEFVEQNLIEIHSGSFFDEAKQQSNELWGIIIDRWLEGESCDL